MNPETRLIVNQAGFCNRHFPMMREAGHAHHLGLLSHTHLQTVRKNLKGVLNGLAKGGSKNARDFAVSVKGISDNCLICDSMNRDVDRFAYTAVVLYEKENEFRSLFEKSRGPCLHHGAALATMATDVLNKKESATFLNALSEHMNKALEELEADILKFTQKFDAQNDSMEWGTSRDAHARTVQMLSGSVVRLED